MDIPTNRDIHQAQVVITIANRRATITGNTRYETALHIIIIGERVGIGCDEMGGTDIGVDIVAPLAIHQLLYTQFQSRVHLVRSKIASYVAGYD